MDNLRPFIATRTAVTMGTTVAAAVMLTVSAVALLASWGMMVVAAGFNIVQSQKVSIAITSPGSTINLQYTPPAYSFSKIHGRQAKSLGADHIAVNVLLKDADTVPVPTAKKIYAITLTNAKVTLESPESFLRVMAAEFPVFKTDYVVYGPGTFDFSDFAAETAILPDGIKLNELTIEADRAQIYIESIDYLTQKPQGSKTVEKILQDQDASNIISLNNKIIDVFHYQKWTAGVTEISKHLYQKDRLRYFSADSNFDDKKRQKDKNGKIILPYLGGYEYYGSGVFSPISANPYDYYFPDSRDPSIPDTFDWRNRHGVNWITSPKIQDGCGSCWAFAAAGVVEAVAGIRYNDPALNLDLAEQDFLSCSGAGTCNGGASTLALKYMQTQGIVTEDCFPYQHADADCSRCSNFDNSSGRYWKITSTDFATTWHMYAVDIKSIFEITDTIKKSLIKYGPLTFYLPRHVEVLVGYREEAGRTYWITKDSAIGDWDELDIPFGYTSWPDYVLGPYPVNQTKETLCSDRDNDHFCFWGLAIEKPESCRSLNCADTPDFDDGNPLITCEGCTLCSDGVDNNGDGKCDYNGCRGLPADPDCYGPEDNSEQVDCNDGIDNDGDGYCDSAGCMIGGVQYPPDPGCSSAQDQTETNPAIACDDGIDNDGDGYCDFKGCRGLPPDPGCASVLDPTETNSQIQCDDGIDNDGNKLIDLADPGCTSSTDNTEQQFLQLEWYNQSVLYGTNAKTHAVYDIDRDGNQEIILGQSNGFVMVVKYIPQAAGIQYDQYFGSEAIKDYYGDTPLIADIDQDNAAEIILGLLDGTIRAYKFDRRAPTSGRLLMSTQEYWIFPTEGPASVAPSFALGDINHDERLEVVAGAENGKVYALRHDGTPIWNLSTPGRIIASPAIADIDNDSDLEVIVGSNNTVYAIDSDGTKLWKYPTGSLIKSSPAIADIDHDGKSEVIVGSDDKKIHVINHDGSPLWNFPTQGWMNGSPAIADINGDGDLEVAAASGDGQIYIIKHDGSLLWSFNTYGTIWSSPIVADLNNDRSMEVIIGTNDGYLFIVNQDPRNPSFGREVWRYRSPGRYPTTPFLTDIENDGKLEFILFTSDGHNRFLSVYEVLPRNGEAPWPMYQHDIYRTGWYGYVPVLPKPLRYFLRGDANGDGAVDIADAEFTLRYLFLDGLAPPCLDAADANDDGEIFVDDPIFTLLFKFAGGPPPPPPGTINRGPDPTADSLGCQGP